MTPIPVVLLHALATDPRLWAAQQEPLAQTNPVLVPNLYRLGEGTSSFHAVAARLATLLDDHGLDRVVLAGCSLGGYLAMEFLRHHNDRVHALALIGTRAAADDAATRARRLAFADPASAPALITMILPKLLGAGTRRRCPDVVTRVAGMARSVSGVDIAWAQRLIAARPSSWDALAAFPRPAVVLMGTEDELVPVAAGAAVASALPRGRVQVVPDAGHLLPLEAPLVVSESIKSLLVPEREPIP